MTNSQFSPFLGGYHALKRLHCQTVRGFLSKENLIMNPGRFTDMVFLQLPSSLILVLYQAFWQEY